MMTNVNLASTCDQVKKEPTVDWWYCGNPPKHLVNGKTLCTFHANKLRLLEAKKENND